LRFAPWHFAFCVLCLGILRFAPWHLAFCILCFTFLRFTFPDLVFCVCGFYAFAFCVSWHLYLSMRRHCTRTTGYLFCLGPA
jgi:hypothetical protein